MTPELLRAAGEALYGDRWQSAIAADLGVNDRTIRRWVAGEREIPADLAPRLAALVEGRLNALTAAHKALTRSSSNPPAHS